jgi:hypothetical protein
MQHECILRTNVLHFQHIDDKQIVWQGDTVSIFAVFIEHPYITI